MVSSETPPASFDRISDSETLIIVCAYGFIFLGASMSACAKRGWNDLSLAIYWFCDVAAIFPALSMSETNRQNASRFPSPGAASSAAIFDGGGLEPGILSVSLWLLEYAATSPLNMSRQLAPIKKRDSMRMFSLNCNIRYASGSMRAKGAKALFPPKISGTQRLQP